MANVSREQNRATQEQIRLHAARLFTENGFPATTVREIATAAKVSESSIFTYFNSKDELLVRIVLPEAPQQPLPVRAATPWQAVAAITRHHLEPLSRLDKRLLCEYQAAVIRATSEPESAICRATSERDHLYTFWLAQVLASFAIDNAPLVTEIVSAIVLCTFQSYITRRDVTFDQFLAQTEKQVHYLLRDVQHNRPKRSESIVLALP